jgi:hypothetical protein
MCGAIKNKKNLTLLLNERISLKPGSFKASSPLEWLRKHGTYHIRFTGIAEKMIFLDVEELYQSNNFLKLCPEQDIQTLIVSALIHVYGLS